MSDTSIQSAVDLKSSGSSEDAGLGEIDHSVRVPVLILAGASLLWLLWGTLLALIASFKLHAPDFLAGYECLTYGRVYPAGVNALIYGWGVNAALAVTIWLMAHLSRASLMHGGLLIIAALFWNVGVDVGVWGILIGHSQSIEFLEIPAYATPLLFVSYALMGVWGVLTFRYRRNRHTYVSQWFLLAALFSFPWIYSIAQIMLVVAPVRGTVQSLINVWYVQNTVWLWFTPIGLAAAYYFIPKVLGKPIHSYYLAALGFWTLIVFASWSSMTRLIGGPIPAWVISTGVVGGVLLIIPIVVTSINLHMTVLGSLRDAWNSPTLRFVVFGAISFSAVGILTSITSLRSIGVTTQFTHFAAGLSHLGFYGFFTMVMFGSFYFLIPRLLDKEWPSASLISLHFWGSSLGAGICVASLLIGGINQGLQMNDAAAYPEFIEIVRATLPYLLSRTVGVILITLGQLAFFTSFVWILIQPRTSEVTEPTLFDSSSALKSIAP
jgi:cytochrome c oxidase cbb3-type subunit 1